ncbi:MAG: ferredoxin:glutaredoxin reductase [Deltaproteobacteria bacterium]|nr:ferredoxin:glutaredoxin reductase [Deltaproteobacteria bacterium]
MTDFTQNSPDTIESYKKKLIEETSKTVYSLTDDEELLNDLVDGMIINENRYGYPSCPCRMANGDLNTDRDIICPCVYRDSDLAQFGMCYCGLYQTEEFINSGNKIKPIPDRHSGKFSTTEAEKSSDTVSFNSKTVPVWRCTVCGYLASVEFPPVKCPVCKAKSDRFEKTSLVTRSI